MSIPHWAVKGAKVTCVDNDEHPELTVGAVYTVIRAFRPEPFWHGLTSGKYAKSTVWVVVREVENRTGDVWGDPSFAIERFRPLVTRTQEQDVAQFRELLTPSLDELAEAVRKQGEELDATLRELEAQP